MMMKLKGLNMTGDLLTIKAIAQKLGLAESTARYFRDKFPEYMPAVQHGRRKLYRPEALKVFKIIAEETQKRRSAEEIAERLSSLFAVNIEPNNQNAEQSAAEQQSSNSLELYRQDIDSRQELAEAIRQLVEQNQELIKELRRPWWKRLFGIK